MNCSDLRESLSARIDGEQPVVAEEVLDEHLAGCPACRMWQERAVALRRGTLVREAPHVPDLTARILAEVPAPQPWRLRLALGLVALLQSGLGLAELLGTDVGHAAHGGLVAAAHLGNESAAWNVAVGVGLLWAAVRPSAASGLLPALGGFVVVLAVVSAIDLSTGQVTASRVASHGLLVAGVALLVAVRRQHARRPDPRSSAGIPLPGADGTGGSEGTTSAVPRRSGRRRFRQLPSGRRTA